MIVNLDMLPSLGSSHLDNDIVNVKGELSQLKARFDPFSARIYFRLHSFTAVRANVYLYRNNVESVRRR